MELERPPQHGNGDLLSRLVAAVTTLGLSSHLSPHPTPRSRTLTHNTKLNPPPSSSSLPFLFLCSFPPSLFHLSWPLIPFFYSSPPVLRSRPPPRRPLSQANSYVRVHMTFIFKKMTISFHDFPFCSFLFLPVPSSSSRTTTRTVCFRPPAYVSYQIAQNTHACLWQKQSKSVAEDKEKDNYECNTFRRIIHFSAHCSFYAQHSRESSTFLKSRTRPSRPRSAPCGRNPPRKKSLHTSVIAAKAATRSRTTIRS